MLDRRTRAQIEWHFYNYEADKSLAEQKAKDITYSNLTANTTPSVGHGNKIGNPTEWKAEKLFELGREWADVVRNTFNAFKFEPEYDIMIALYVKHMPKHEVIKKYFQYGAWERTFYRWREKWLEKALDWAKEYKLM